MRWARLVWAGPSPITIPIMISIAIAITTTTAINADDSGNGNDNDSANNNICLLLAFENVPPLKKKLFGVHASVSYAQGEGGVLSDAQLHFSVGAGAGAVDGGPFVNMR